MRYRAATLLACLLALIPAFPVGAGPLRELLAQRLGESSRVDLPIGATLLRDQPYGDDPSQKLDVYVPANARNAPVIVMVHGGAWRNGDKAAPSVVQNKIARWLPMGFVFVSVDYPMLPQRDALGQADDVARALAFAQARAKSWGGDPDKFILMGHSAGAHLVALLAADPERAYRFGAKPWLGTVLLDSAALDVPRIMANRHLPFYDDAFGADPARWKLASPIDALSREAKPILAVCSLRRPDQPCERAADFAAKATALGVHCQLSRQNLSHRQINVELGLPGKYTDDVESFMAGLDPQVATALQRPR